MKQAPSATKFFVRITSALMKRMWEGPQRRDIPLVWSRRTQAPPTFSNGAVRLAAFFQIALVIFLRAPELRRRFDFGHNRSIELAAFGNFLLRLLGRGFLFGRMIENYRTVLRADIRALPI